MKIQYFSHRSRSCRGNFTHRRKDIKDNCGCADFQRGTQSASFPQHVAKCERTHYSAATFAPSRPSLRSSSSLPLCASSTKSAMKIALVSFESVYFSSFCFFFHACRRTRSARVAVYETRTQPPTRRKPESCAHAFLYAGGRASGLALLLISLFEYRLIARIERPFTLSVGLTKR